MTPDEIYAESFRRIESAVGSHSFTPAEWLIVRRMIHASGDLDLVQDVCFTRDAAAVGIDALALGVPVVTDVQMVAAGLVRPMLERLGVRVHCFIADDDVAQRARAEQQTRSHFAMRKAIESVGTAVYVIGNAPTALLALCAAVRSGEVRPRLIVALPVGFVSVVESKEEALRLEVPVLALRGHKGGSGMAAAAVNALLLQAAEGRPSAGP